MYFCMANQAWLNLLTDQRTVKTASQMERSVSKSGELNLPVSSLFSDSLAKSYFLGESCIWF